MAVNACWSCERLDVRCSRREIVLKSVIYGILCAVLICHVDAETLDCNTIRQGLATRGISTSDLLAEPINGDHLRVCPVSGQTCCSESTETRLGIHSRQQFEKTAKESLGKLSSVLNTRSQRFDEYFRRMLTNSKREFNEMFKKTYGAIYVQNSHVFTDLFEDLEQYYYKGRVDLTEAIDNFFGVLYQRMFTVINAQYHFDDKYLACVADHMKDLRPFGDVPHKFNLQVKRSFVATRTFSKALYVGAEVSKNMLNIKPTQECAKSLLRMQHCASCAGVPTAKACSNYCINVMKGCLAYHATLETEWNNYVDAIDKVADRLLGPFNIEVVVQPINIKISEAIMNFQENGVDVSQRVYTGCGKPVLGRAKRSLLLSPINNEYRSNVLRSKYSESDDYDLQFEDTVIERNPIIRKPRASNKELSFETLNFNEKNNQEGQPVKKGKVAHSKPEEPTFERLIREIKHIAKDSKKFWSNLPYQICNNDDLADGPSNSVSCWNGTDVGKYFPIVVADGLNNQKNNPAVFVDTNKQNSMINEQIFSLKAIVSKLHSAHQGMDVDWIDYEESMSTYVSGSGSGEDDTEPELPDEVEGSGSGRGKVFFEPGSPHVPPMYNPPVQPEVPKEHVPNVNTYPKNITSNEIPGTSGTNTKSDMTLTRALITYLFPLVVIWLGGMFSDIL